MIYSWQGKYLDVNLTKKKINVQTLSPELLKLTVGGTGLVAHLIYHHVPPEADPLGPENALAFVAGPLGGTTWPGTGRIIVAGLSPLTSLWGDSSMGGYFATQLKRAGYDAILVRGESKIPVTLVIMEDGVELRPSIDVWGMETYQAEERLLVEYPESEVITIGPAGENLVPMASLVHHQGNNVAGRCGLGAVAGSKRLKAIVANGKKSIKIANQDAFTSLKREAIKLFNEDDFIFVIRNGSGTAAAAPIAIEMADLTARNWDLDISEWGKEEAHKITGPTMQTEFPSKKDTCYACPVACKWSLEAQRNDGNLGRMSGPEYESLAGLGAQVQVSETLSVIQSVDLCNRLGIDTISTGSTIAWALEAHEKNLIPPKYLDDDIKLCWGDDQLVLELVKRIGGNRPGLGALLAKGTRRAVQIIKGGKEFAIQVKGLELPFHHPRSMRGLEIAYATLPLGATHNEEGAVFDDEDMTYEDWVNQSIENMNLSGANSSMVYCQFLAGALNAEYSSRLLEAATGKSYTKEDVLRVGERAWYLRRIFNLRLGVGLEEDTLPKRIIEQIKESQAILNDFEVMLKEFYKKRGLDERGVPSAYKLAEVGLDDLIEELGAR